ncbi:MAG: adenylosuccinate synthetase [Candidatus Micrarchaeota archaeon]|nr:adenylosuccinate synthetase [Candidatus Micrarchaeota archaeon]
MICDIVVGGQFGDEGKGKVISYLALNDQPEVIARSGVGPNAGHQVFYKGRQYSLRQVPSGFVYDKARLLVGAGVLVSPSVFLREVTELDIQKRVGVDRRCTAITDEHIKQDGGANSEKIGTTKTGCGPANMDRVNRTAKLVSEIPELAQYLCDVPTEVNAAKKALIEGTQGFMLSLLYGTYPFVTSKDTSASTMAADVGVGPKNIRDVIMVVKAYTTRVGNGPFKFELPPEKAKELGFAEYGTVTGRPRRVSDKLHFDDLRYAAMINSASIIALTKLDVRFPSCAHAKKYSQLTDEARKFVEEIEAELHVPAKIIGTGADAEDIIDRR